MNSRLINKPRLIGQLSMLGALSLAGSVHAAGAFTEESPWMTGDWGGARTELLEKGYDFSLEYVGEVGSNLNGGYNDDTTARYSDQFALGVKMDLEKILGWNDAEFKLAITERSGRNISNDRIGDPRAGTLSSSQEVWGRGQTWRLTQMWYKQGYFDNKLNVKIGRFGPGEEFNSFPCDFQNLAFCGSQVGNWVGNIWYNWPVSQWALRIKYNITPEVYAQVGVFEQNPSYLETGNGFKLSGSGTKGMILPVELVWTPKLNDLPGEYRLGYYYSTAKADDVYEDGNGQAAAVSGASYKSHSSKHGAWIVAQQQLTSHNGSAARGLSIFANATVHDKDTNFVDNYQQIGLTYMGPFDARPKDDIGVGIARIHVNDDVRKNRRLVNDLNNVDDYDNPTYLPIQDTEYNAEIYYGFHVTNWLTVRPNVQYIKHPGGVNQVDDALVAGLKIQSKF
ncbi:carbohydrate porin [Pseudomonas coleopterorum]|jgi:porin|uniref:Carbohydrate porin n=2 Tax=Pseudomonas TaxID=286 RepID=A0ABR9BS59_9PSED|nr:MULTISPECIES: carbohydrate porin [Pseudomonas]KNC06930.1 porin [Pseudomonas sp. RIT-PI-a]KQQ57388.1 porin [Pseudomonas sp. Leaf129]MBD8483312.1 carbohydrate porin [Pseudomonas coleopterorum]MBD8755018.1 carbohydrate porin [Pseudomonas coleopterorum]MBD8767986.1 carbohydrate porin [Pseudomonas coleopterorum]